jgi:N-acetylmuramic acid 6-phosphate etherase
MVDVVPSNRKLVDRAESIIMEIAGCGRKEAGEYLRLSGMRPKVAALMKAGGLGREAAERLLEESEGSLRKALERAKG